jgi:hypothetical protein
MKSTKNFWPFNFDEDGEIYDNPAWDLPGLKRVPKHRHGAHPPAPRDAKQTE